MKIVLQIFIFSIVTSLFFSCNNSQVCDCMELSIEIFNKTKMNDSLLKTYTKLHEKDIQTCNKMFDEGNEKENAAINKESKNCPSYLDFVSKNKK